MMAIQVQPSTPLIDIYHNMNAGGVKEGDTQDKERKSSTLKPPGHRGRRDRRGGDGDGGGRKRRMEEIMMGREGGQEVHSCLEL